MGSKSKGGSSSMQQAAQKNYSYGGTNMTQDAANQKYAADLAAWRAPTATGTGVAGQDIGNVVADASTNFAGTGHLGVPTLQVGMGQGGGPGIPTVGVLPTAPTRTTLAKTMTSSNNNNNTSYYNNAGNTRTTGTNRPGAPGYYTNTGNRR